MWISKTVLFVQVFYFAFFAVVSEIRVAARRLRCAVGQHREPQAGGPRLVHQLEPRDLGVQILPLLGFEQNRQKTYRCEIWGACTPGLVLIARGSAL